MPSEAVVQQIWLVSLAVYFAAVIAVAVLLTLILVTARQIRAGTAAIWTVGQKVANNTIHVPLLVRTNRLAVDILESAGRTVGAVRAIRMHAEACPRCPACVTGDPPGGS